MQGLRESTESDSEIIAYALRPRLTCHAAEHLDVASIGERSALARMTVLTIQQLSQREQGENAQVFLMLALKTANHGHVNR